MFMRNPRLRAARARSPCAPSPTNSSSSVRYDRNETPADVEETLIFFLRPILIPHAPKKSFLLFARVATRLVPRRILSGAGSRRGTLPRTNGRRCPLGSSTF